MRLVMVGVWRVIAAFYSMGLRVVLLLFTLRRVIAVIM